MSITNEVVGIPGQITQLVGEERNYWLDTTPDGGLPSGATVSVGVIKAYQRLTNVDITTAIVPSGITGIDGNKLLVKVKAPSAMMFNLRLNYTNAIGTPCSSFWRFQIVEMR